MSDELEQLVERITRAVLDTEGAPFAAEDSLLANLRAERPFDVDEFYQAKTSGGRATISASAITNVWRMEGFALIVPVTTTACTLTIGDITLPVQNTTFSLTGLRRLRRPGDQLTLQLSGDGPFTWWAWGTQLPTVSP